MKNWRSHLRMSLGAALALAVCPVLGMRTARAGDPLGLYIGAAYGQAHIRVQQGALIPQSTGSLGGLDRTHSAYQAIVGIRPLSFLGAEVTYMDFGTASDHFADLPVPGLSQAYVTEQQASQKGEAAFALLYLPVPVVDVYVRAGLSRIVTDVRATYVEPLPCAGTQCTSALGQFTASRGSTDTAFAYGAGLQWKLGSWAVRGDYERFDAAGANPTLLSIGMTYWLP
jgi:opacity protein-like surface antigen